MQPTFTSLRRGPGNDVAFNRGIGKIERGGTLDLFFRSVTSFLCPISTARITVQSLVVHKLDSAQ